MAITTLGQLMHWLLQTPHTRLETLRATEASPEDLVAAISLLIARNQLCAPVLVGDRLLFRTRNAPLHPKTLALPIAGCLQENQFRKRHKAGPWIHAAIQGAAREWMTTAGAASDDTETAVRAEAFLARRLGRRASDGEVQFFWDLVDAGREPILGAGARPRMARARSSDLAGH